jgi:hypothetical protein
MTKQPLSAKLTVFDIIKQKGENFRNGYAMGTFPDTYIQQSVMVVGRHAKIIVVSYAFIVHIYDFSSDVFVVVKSGKAFEFDNQSFYLKS